MNLNLHALNLKKLSLIIVQGIHTGDIKIYRGEGISAFGQMRQICSLHGKTEIRFSSSYTK